MTKLLSLWFRRPSVSRRPVALALFGLGQSSWSDITTTQLSIFRIQPGVSWQPDV